MGKTYTYILKDTKLDLYKIGRTKNPPARFQSLCALKEIIPIAIIDEDVESSLHEIFDDNRIDLNAKVESGKTEWFKRGGTFDAFIDSMDDAKSIPFLSPHYVVKELLNRKKFKILGYNSNWKFSQIDAAQYLVGYKILEILGVIEGGVISANFKDYGDIFKGKVIFNKEVIDYIAGSYEVFVTEKGNESSFGDLLKEEHKIGEAILKKDGITFIILIKKSIISKEDLI